MYTPTQYNQQANDIAAKINQLQQMQFPMQMPSPPPIPPQIDYVKGIEGAREFLRNMPASGKKILMDQDDAIFYVVSKDANGTPAPIMFSRFELQTEQEPEQPMYVTKSDFDKAIDEIKKMLKGGNQ